MSNEYKKGDRVKLEGFTVGAPIVGTVRNISVCAYDPTPRYWISWDGGRDVPGIGPTYLAAHLVPAEARPLTPGVKLFSFSSGDLA